MLLRKNKKKKTQLFSDDIKDHEMPIASNNDDDNDDDDDGDVGVV